MDLEMLKWMCAFLSLATCLLSVSTVIILHDIYNQYKNFVKEKRK